MRRDDGRLVDILDALDWIANAVAGLTESEFLADDTLRYAVAHRLVVVGESAARLSHEFKQRHRSVPWQDVVGLRNLLVHQYFGVHWPLVWQTVRDHAPRLRSQIADIVEGGF